MRYKPPLGGSIQAIEAVLTRLIAFSEEHGLSMDAATYVTVSRNR